MLSPSAKAPVRLLAAVGLFSGLPGPRGLALDPVTLEPGVSLELARHRASQIHDLRYDLLSFNIPAEPDRPVTGQVSLSWRAENPAAPIVLDFAPVDGRIESVRLNDRPVVYAHTNEHLVVRDGLAPGRDGRYSLRVRFVAGTAPMNRREDFLYTLFVPARARECFPCFDQPDLKARFTLSLEIPSAWQALANAPVDFEKHTTDSRKRIRFKPTALLPTYLFAFTAGRYEVLERTRDGRRIRMFHRESDPERIARNLDRVLELHFDALDWLEAYTGIPQPFAKFDFALVPGFQYGGMEHAGAILYRDRSILLDATPTAQEKLRRASLIAHETAHMWFGNLVTMRWFNEVWLKEVFANFFAAKIVNPAFPEMNHDLQFLLRHYPGAYRIDRSEGPNPILQDLGNLADAGSIYGAIIYLKAPIVMRQLEERIGSAAFQEAIRDYLARYAWGNADFDDLVRCFEESAKEDLAAWVNPLVKGTGLPRLSSDRDPFAYGMYPLEKGALGRDLETRVRDANPLLRGAAWLELRENMLAGKIARHRYLDFLRQRLPHERDPQLSAYLLDILREDSLWQDTQRRGISDAQASEGLLWNLMRADYPASMRKAFFKAWVALLRSPGMVERLHAIWSGKGELDLALSEPDESYMAMELAVRGVDVLAAQRARIADADRRKRFAFIMPALSPDPGLRAAYFQALSRAEKRQPEPWVLTALRYLQHPVRVEQDLADAPFESMQDLGKLLALLPEVKATGDIFFPKAWLDAGFSGHRSAPAAEIIRRYLETHPDLAGDLRLKLLQAADPVFRAARESGTR